MFDCCYMTDWLNRWMDGWQLTCWSICPNTPFNSDNNTPSISSSSFSTTWTAAAASSQNGVTSICANDASTAAIRNAIRLITVSLHHHVKIRFAHFIWCDFRGAPQGFCIILIIEYKGSWWKRKRTRWWWDAMRRNERSFCCRCGASNRFRLLFINSIICRFNFFLFRMSAGKGELNVGSLFISSISFIIPPFLRFFVYFLLNFNLISFILLHGLIRFSD